jgi:hypothetical protein
VEVEAKFILMFNYGKDIVSVISGENNGLFFITVIQMEN